MNAELPMWERLRNDKSLWYDFEQRAKIIREIRNFFLFHAFLEIEPPLLSPYPTLDSNIMNMKTCFNDLTGLKMELYLHTSPEHSLKKLLAAGARKIYYMGKVFRDGELTPLHNPEFTIIEWYRSEASYIDIMEDTERLIHGIVHIMSGTDRLKYKGSWISFALPWNRISINELFMNHLNINIVDIQSISQLRNAAKDLQLHWSPADRWDDIFFRIFIEKIEPHLPKDPIFLIDYPVQLGLMAKCKPENPLFVERVELYVAGIELANGYTECTDSDEQQNRFHEEQNRKFKESGNVFPVDMELIYALQAGIPPSAGIALGLDRLCMILLNKSRIEDILLFPIHHWRSSID